jgi:hypothetical protein
MRMRLPSITVSSTSRTRGSIGQFFLWGGLAGFVAGIALFLALLLTLGVYVQLQWAQRRRDLKKQAHSSEKLLPQGKSALSKADLAFGEAQVARMVADRPEMAKVKPPDPIWRYCVKAFAGEAIGERVYWNPVEPTGGYSMVYDLPTDGATPCIRFSRTEGWVFDYGTGEAWYRAAYGLEGLRGYRTLDALRAKGLHGDLSREQWVRSASRLSFEHLKRLNQVYRTYWRPTADSRRLGTPGGNSWATDLPATYKEWFARVSNDGWSEYGLEYDQNMAPIRELALEVQKLRTSTGSITSSLKISHLPGEK